MFGSQRQRPHEWISAFFKEISECPLTLSTMCGPRKDGVSEQQVGFHQTPQQATP